RIFLRERGHHRWEKRSGAGALGFEQERHQTCPTRAGGGAHGGARCAEPRTFRVLGIGGDQPVASQSGRFEGGSPPRGHVASSAAPRTRGGKETRFAYPAGRWSDDAGDIVPASRVSAEKARPDGDLDLPAPVPRSGVR